MVLGLGLKLLRGRWSFVSYISTKSAILSETPPPRDLRAQVSAALGDLGALVKVLCGCCCCGCHVDVASRGHVSLRPGCGQPRVCCLRPGLFSVAPVTLLPGGSMATLQLPVL